MKLERLSIQNFLRVKELDLDLSHQPIHLFCGPNEAGKSTIGDAVRFVLRGDSPRVNLKKDYKRLITLGSKKGRVSIEYDGGQLIARDVGTGSTDSKIGDLEPAAQQALEIALGAQRFSSMKPDERRRMLFALCEVHSDAESVVALMQGEKWGVKQELANRLRPALRSSIEAAWLLTREEQTKLRSAWEVHAGEKHGVKKAEGWKPEVKYPTAVLHSDKGVQALETQIEGINAELQTVAKEVGLVEAGLVERAKLEDQKETINKLSHNLSVLLQDKKTVEAQRDTAQEELTTQAELLRRATEAVAVLTCPACDQALHLENGELEFVDPEKQNFRMDDDVRKQTEEKVTRARNAVNTFTAQLTTLDKQINVAQSGSMLLQDIAARLAVLPQGDKMEELENSITIARGALDELRRGLAVAKEIDRLKQSAVDRQAKAADVHAKIVDWAKAEAALEPAGIPSEMLSEALDQINGRMEASAGLAGWPVPRIDADMNIERTSLDAGADEWLRFELLSESAQWRTSAIVGEAIADMSGVKLLVLDRLDVLDLPGRGEALSWIETLAKDSFDTILMMATLKAPPKGLSDAIAVHWLEAGEVVSAQEAA